MPNETDVILAFALITVVATAITIQIARSIIRGKAFRRQMVAGECEAIWTIVREQTHLETFPDMQIQLDSRVKAATERLVATHVRSCRTCREIYKTDAWPPMSPN